MLDLVSRASRRIPRTPHIPHASVRTAKAQAQADAANKAVIDYHETRTAAQNAAVANDGDAAKIVNEARGGTNEGKSPSQIREAATLPDRKALTGV